MTDSPASLDDLAVRRAFRACLDADVPWERAVHLLWLGMVWQDVQRRREEDRKLLRDVSDIRGLWTTPFSASDLYRSIGGL